MNILADASLPGLKEAFPSPFHLTCYTHHGEIPHLLNNQDILLCRANLLVNESLLAHHCLRYVATASSGSDNLDHYYLQQRQITALDAKGCNAISVADYVISCLAFLDERNLIKGKKVGIIGLGHVGSTLYPRLKAADFKLSCYDPLKALNQPTFSTCTLAALYECDVLCIHAELHDKPPYPSRGFINEDFLQKLKPTCVIINASRGGIVNEEALLNHQFVYCTDVYHNEPQIKRELIDYATLCTPHIAGHSLEAKFAAVALISRTLHEHLHLPVPPCLVPQPPKKHINQAHETWQTLALALYNPFHETQLLKQASNLELSFLELRKQHCNRHDFNTYLNDSIPLKIKKIIG